MDLKALQARLRDFAAARDWQPFHSPKNLAMALMVESAELLELFQWLTTEQSNTLTRDAADKERVGDEIADVLLYLLQLADRTGVDVEEAVEQKLRKNAEKHPAKHPEKPAPGPKGHLLIDWENVQPRGEELRALVPEGTDVWIFHGPQQKVEASSHRLAYGASKVALVPRPGLNKKNALDFQLSYYIGYISARQPHERFVVVSNDTGYDPMLEHACELGFDARRVSFRRQSPPVVATSVKRKVKAAVAKPTLALKPVYSPVQLIAPSAAQIAWRAIVQLRAMSTAGRGRPADLEAFMESLINEPVMDKPGLACRASQLLRDRPLGLGRAAVDTPRSTAALVRAIQSPAAPTPVAQPLPTVVVEVPAKAKTEASAKATRQDVQRLAQFLDGLAPAKRPAQKEELLVLLQYHLGETSGQAPRVTQVLAQLQAQKRVAIKRNVVSFPPSPAAAPVPAKKTAAKKAATPAVPKAIPKPTAAQVAKAVLGSLGKMPKNKPTRRAGLLKFIETHATKAADPKSIAQQVCALLEARRDVVVSPDGKGVTYPKF
ncbi:MAG: nucleotide pyrophosphohydrolase [Gammaproteobacteria bacterium]|jgi:NTP pyrophosphatase (non-canonical NTP hydrolase)|nr:nucleotide pyrophosphohydrolase [Gammaproteobacteria bacterium]MBU0830660.1 nucleotide pyrophosphohydrolase [Gammaproteobacteria bacterium]MBU0893501.1 nucleotide pyrophosphohydrolase [Gammaproteobacteria bacterium]MBU1818374.1 nucleotide pyrophosphohydrolase [Gammaproteobacteria bacterium]